MPPLRPARRPPLPVTVLAAAGLLIAVSTGPAVAAPTTAPPSPAAAGDAPSPVGSTVADAGAGRVTGRTETSTAMDIPADVTAGVAVYDRLTGRFTEQHQADRAFRSASVVKLLLALDFSWNRGPAYGLPQADRVRLGTMLRSSDDAAASHYWSTGGGSAVITRMALRLSLTGTTPPPAACPGYWGYTATTAADTVRVYRYLLDEAPAPVRSLVLGALHRSTRCATDGFDQHFGPPSAFDAPGAVKQGWSGFASGGCTATGTRTAAPGTSVPAANGTGGNGPQGTSTAVAPALDLTSDALHTTGTAGPGDRTVVAVLTLHPEGTPYGSAYSKVTALTGSLDVPGAVRPSGTRFTTWGSGVRVRSGATTSSTVLTTLPSGVDVLVGCQRQGERVPVPPYVNDWWAYLPQYGGWITHIYVASPDSTLPGVPHCS